jgi:epoxyqueuosine reductase
MDGLKQWVCERAAQLGLDDCRIAAAAPPPSVGHFQSWLRDGFHGAMVYLKRSAPKRCDPQEVLRGARSVIVLAMNYAARREDPTDAHPCLTPGVGWVARYARYADYHEVMGKRLQTLADFLCSAAGADARALWYVDTGPVLERDLAQRAGLGFVGKHTNLIHRRLGNWFFLGEILTTVALEPDPPELNHCGRCTRCLTACPTQAIVEPFRLDARKCLAYLTIEWKGSIPVEYRSALGRRIFGCDNCLEACPWNRFAREASQMRSMMRPDLQAPVLLELLELDEMEYRRRFAGTPLERIKRRGLRRNVCVALGNAGGVADLPALARAVGDPDPLIAEHAQWAMEQIQARIDRPSPT